MDLFSSSSSSFFQEELMNGDMLLWDFSSEPFDLVTTAPNYLLPPQPEELPVATPPSAFARYVRPEVKSLTECSGSRSNNEKKNIHHRVIEMLRRTPTARPENKSGCEHSRGFRHMMRERQRRERLSQSYADLHSMLPYRSKADKNSIVQTAVAYVKELKRVKEELTRRNEELKTRNERKSNFEGSKIKIRVANPTSTLDSMIGSLQCLKAMDVKTRAIQTEFSGNELTAVMNIESKVGASEVERTLMATCR